MRIKEMLYYLSTKISIISADSGWQTLDSYTQYRKKSGVVYVIMENRPKPTSSPIATLPAGYRPTSSKNVQCFMKGGATLVNCWIKSDGTINVDYNAIPSGVTLIGCQTSFPV